MDTIEHYHSDSMNRHLSLLRKYEDMVEKLFPDLGKRTIDSHSGSAADILFMGQFLSGCSHGAVILEKGVSIGNSTCSLASHPKVSRVIGVDRNPLISGNPQAHRSVPNGSQDHESSNGLRMLDIARATLAEYVTENQKVELHDRAQIAKKDMLPAVSSAKGEYLVIILNDPENREEVANELESIFEQHPQAIVFLSHCRYSKGPFTQAGMVDFQSQAEGEYHFRLIADLGPGLAGSNLGIIYSEQSASRVEETLEEVRKSFSERLDPLRLLQREEEFVEALNRSGQDLRKTNSRLRAQVTELEQQLKETRKSKRHFQSQASRLQERNAHLKAHYSSRRYKLADTVFAIASRALALKDRLLK